MLTPYIVKRSEDLANLRDTLGKLNVLEKDLANKFDKDYKEGKYVEDSTKVVEDTPIMIAPKTGNIEIQIDDYGNSYEVILDGHGNEISRRQVPNNF